MPIWIIRSAIAESYFFFAEFVCQHKCLHSYLLPQFCMSCVQKFDKELYITDGEMLCDVCVCV